LVASKPGSDPKPGHSGNRGPTPDVVIVGGGNAALCAALSARESGASVLVLERAPREARGGNSAFTGGAFRVAYDGVDDLMKVMPDLSKEEREGSDFGAYTEATYLEDLGRLSGWRMDPDLGDELVKSSLDTILWMRGHGVRFIPIYGRQAFKVDGKHRFWGGLTIEVSGGGLGLVESLYAAAGRAGVAVEYGAQATGLVRQGDRITGVEYRQGGEVRSTAARAVILAAGGFHASAEWRARYLGHNWDLARVRGSRYNTGDGIRMALDVGAMSWGNWSGCHSVFYDMNAPHFGNIDMLNQQKNYFSLGIVVNAEGRRFVDEGSDFRNYIYSNMGRRVLEQPAGIAWQVFDSKTAALLPDEYRVRWTTRVESRTLEDLAGKLEGVDPKGFLATVGEFNAAVMKEVPFNPAARDGRGTRGLAVPKSNWANALDEPPYVAFGVTCGITLTYGGIRIDTRARVLDCEEKPIPGLYAAGELVGGLYYVNYPGGAGLMSGSVFGRIAGRDAAQGRTP
jgi:tricarballylate dehydrogenase